MVTFEQALEIAANNLGIEKCRIENICDNYHIQGWKKVYNIDSWSEPNDEMEDIHVVVNKNFLPVLHLVKVMKNKGEHWEGYVVKGNEDVRIEKFGEKFYSIA